ncbi:DUF6252 family protein [Myroides sp. WP-1]|uniref:DUF6252 family protein n=1 Tax=Myroides sp. WP-1 TaxID=2759944 RepID=UPI0015FB8695|nr:DUF6252 family protein [Myroides sp. WP-1]MBB1139539.1 hypothetical protein [Myroides sp. WP-1]
MRKIIGIFALALGFMACENDVKFSNPGMHATMTLDAIVDTAKIKGNPYSHFTEYKPQSFKAYVVNDKTLIIDAKTDSTQLRIYLPDYEFGAKYEFNATENIKADYLVLNDFDVVTSMYSTDALSLKDQKPVNRPGYIILDSADKQVPGTISGTFAINMNASKLPETEVDEMNNPIKRYVDRKTFDGGTFYRIPLEKGK